MNLDFMDNIKIAHKGLHDDGKTVPENTLAAIKMATEKGYPIEIDIHLTKDNRIVVIHDDNLFAMVGINKKVKELTYSEISKYYIKNSNEKIPLLEDVLEVVAGKVMLFIELKTYYKVGPLEKELVKLLDKYDGQFAIQSFNPFSVRWFRKNKPEYIRGLLSCGFDFNKYNFIKRVVLRRLWLLKVANPHFVSYEISDLNDNKVRRIKNKNMKLIAWTIDNKEKYDKAIKLCDGIIFEKLTNI